MRCRLRPRHDWTEAQQRRNRALMPLPAWELGLAAAMAGGFRVLYDTLTGKSVVGEQSADGRPGAEYASRAEEPPSAGALDQVLTDVPYIVRTLDQ